jgi:hypothetical protein
MGFKTGLAVEIGAHNGAYCSNTALLIEDGWRGKMIETDYNLYLQCRERWAQYPVNSVCSRVGADNVNAFVDNSCDVLSSDTDGGDYKIFQALLAKPKIVIVEIDSSIPPQEFRFNKDGGASYRAMVELGVDKGYFLLCHTGNICLILNEYRSLFPDIVGDGLENCDLYFNTAWIMN